MTADDYESLMNDDLGELNYHQLHALEANGKYPKKFYPSVWVDTWKTIDPASAR